MTEILYYERANKKSIIGYVDIKASIKGIPIIIRKIAHFQSGDKRWFNLPNLSRQGPDGKDEYLRYWQFETEIYNAQLLEGLDEKVKEYCMKNKIAEIIPLDFSQAPSDNECPF
jgi:hypothetical protein